MGWCCRCSRSLVLGAVESGGSRGGAGRPGVGLSLDGQVPSPGIRHMVHEGRGSRRGDSLEEAGVCVSDPHDHQDPGRGPPGSQLHCPVSVCWLHGPPCSHRGQLRALLTLWPSVPGVWWASVSGRLLPGSLGSLWQPVRGLEDRVLVTLGLKGPSWDTEGPAGAWTRDVERPAALGPSGTPCQAMPWLL